jgi:hypothetical protein
MAGLSERTKQARSHAIGSTSRVGFYRNLFGSINRLEESLTATQKAKVKWKHRFVAASIAAILVSGIAVAITSTNTSYTGFMGETYTFDASVLSLSSNGVGLQVVTSSAAGTSSGSFVEMIATPYGAATTGVTGGHWFYSVTVTEAAIASVGDGITYKVELFQDGTSKGALYMGQNAVAGALPLVVEGVVFKWSLGSTLPSNAAFVVKVTQV